MSVPYVDAESVSVAADWESRFQMLSPSAGVLFVSVKPTPVEGGRCQSFEVRLGISRTMEESTGLSLIKHVLEAEIASGQYEIQGAVYRGSPGAARTHPRAPARASPS
jgi:hypothetical protein